MPRIIAIALPGLLASIASAQIESHELSHSTGMRLAPLAGASHLILSERRFGIDSSHAQVLHADAAWNVTPLAARRFQYPLWYLFDAAPTPSGMVVSGVVTSGSVPQLHAVNADGSLAWVTGFSGMLHSQHRIAILFSEGPAIHGYTNQDGFFGSGMYRVEAEQTGSTFAYRETVMTGTQFRFYHGAKAASPDHHVLGGSIRTTSSSDYDALLGHFTADGATWIKRLDLGSPLSGTEQVTGVVRMSNGDYAWAMFASGTPARGYVLRTDVNGAPLNGAVIEGPANLYLAGIEQLGDGSLIVAGSNGTIPYLIRLTDTGGLITAMECTTCTLTGIGRFHRDAPGVLLGLGGSAIHSIGPDGEACDYLPISTITSNPFTPVLVDQPFVNNPTPAVTTTSLIMLERAPIGSMTQVCVPFGIAEAQGRHPLTAHPVPCADRLRLGAPGEVEWDEPVEVRDMTGALVHSASYNQGIPVSALAPGIYVAVLPRAFRQALFVRAAD